MTTSGEGWQRGPVTPPDPTGLQPWADAGGRRGVLVTIPVVSRRSTMWVYGGLAVWLLVASAGMTVVAVLVEPRFGVVAVVGGVLGLVAAYAFLRTRARTAEQFGLVLRTDGIGVRLPAGSVDLAWGDVVAVRQRWTSRPTGNLLGPVRIDWIVLETAAWRGAARAEVPGVPVAIELLAADPAAVLAMLRRYHASPADRPELADGRALRRFGAPPVGRAPVDEARDPT